MRTWLNARVEHHTDEPPQLLTPAEVGQRMRVHRRTVTRWIADGKLEAIRLPGGEFRIPAHVVEQAMQPYVPTQRADSAAAQTCQGAA